MIVNVEIKCLPWEPDADTPDRVVVRAVVEHLRAGASVPIADVIVSSFDLTAIDACREIAPEIATAWLTSGQDIARAAPVAARARARVVEPRPRRGPARAGPPTSLRRDAGLRVSVWTVDEPGEITALAGAGVDAIITNVPDVAIATLGGMTRSGNDDRERVGLVLDVELLRVAHVVAVDLVGERFAAAHHDAVEVPAVVDAAPVLEELPRPHRRRRPAEQRERVEGPKRRQGERLVETGRGRDRERHAAEIRVRVGLGDDDEAARPR